MTSFQTNVFNCYTQKKVVWIVTFVSVVILDVDFGLLIGVLTSVLIIVVKVQFVTVKTVVKYKDNKYFDEAFVSIPNESTKFNSEVI